MRKSVTDQRAQAPQAPKARPDNHSRPPSPRRRGQSFDACQPHTPMADTSGCHVADGPGSKALISLACPSAVGPFAFCTRRFQPDRPRRAEPAREEQMHSLWPRGSALDARNRGRMRAQFYAASRSFCQTACMRYRTAATLAKRPRRRGKRSVVSWIVGPIRLQAAQSSTGVDSKPWWSSMMR